MDTVKTHDDHLRIRTTSTGRGTKDVYMSLAKTEEKDTRSTTKSFFKSRPLRLSVAALFSAALIGTLVRWPNASQSSQVRNTQDPKVQDVQTLARELKGGLPVSEEGGWDTHECPESGGGFDNCMSCRKERSSGQVECTACYGSHQLLNQNCIRRCGFNERNSENDTDKCELCPPYHIGDRINLTKCKPIVCQNATRQVKAKIGMGDLGNGCNSCPPQTVADYTQKKCIKPVCGDNFKNNMEQNRYRIEQDGTCKACPDYFESTQDKLGCVPIQCPYTHKVVAHGCEGCGMGPFQDPTNPRSCQVPKCDPIEQMYFDYLEGKCKRCLDFELPEAATGYQSCKRTVCLYYQKLNKNGQCSDCPIGEMQSEIDDLQCTPIQCKSHEFIDQLQLKCRKCPDYQVSTTDNMDCHYTKCLSNQIVEKSGSCSFCPAYHSPSPDKLRCIKPVCGKHERATENGGCEPYVCPSGQGFKREADGQWGCTKCSVDHCVKCDKDHQTCEAYSLEGQIVKLLGANHIGEELTALITWPDALQLELNYSPRPMPMYSSGMPLQCPVPDARMHHDIENLHGFGATGNEEQVHFVSLAFEPKDGFGESADGQDIKFQVYFSDSWDPKGKDWDLPYLPYPYQFYILKATTEHQVIGWEYNSALNKYLQVVRANQYEIREGHVQELSFNYKK